MRNLLICSAGRRVSLVSYFKEQANELLGNDSRVYTTDVLPELAPACYLSDQAFKIGRVEDPDYINLLLEVCISNEVKMVVPTIDFELLLLAKHKHRFTQAGITVVISSAELVANCSEKNASNLLFERLGFHIPKPIDIHEPQYPIFARPKYGSSSKDTFVIASEDSLSPFLADRDYFVHQELMPPDRFEEYTVDLYYDRHAILRCAVPRRRIAVRDGEIAKGMTARNRVFEEVKEKLSHLEGAAGCITLQVFLEKAGERIYGIEINPRFGGGYPLSYLAGANYPRMLIQEYLLDQQVEDFDAWEDGLLLLRYDNEMVIHASER
jgi:carbamoyl-phosphate synthase large subunit